MRNMQRKKLSALFLDFKQDSLNLDNGNDKASQNTGKKLTLYAV
jgi:hypothetical protein